MATKKYKDYHAEKLELERKETMAYARTILELVRVCARNSTNFDEFTKLLENAIAKIEAKLDE